jgi:histidinol-phosphatase
LTRQAESALFGDIMQDPGALKRSAERAGSRQKYGRLLDEIAREADAIALRHFRAGEMTTKRKNDGTAVTQADNEVETMARAKVLTSGLSLDVLGEEMSQKDEMEPIAHSRPRLIIDPIDGTEEYSRGIPLFGTLQAVEEQGEIVAAMVSAPALRARWWAYRGAGAFRDGRRIVVSDVASLGESTVFTPGTDPRVDADARIRIRALADAARYSRALGGFWQHMLVAEGCIDAALDWIAKPWDLAPLILIVEEAGGKSTTRSGDRSIYQGNLLSTNGKIHEEAQRLIQ